MFAKQRGNRLDIRHLRYFIAVAQEKNVGKAAVRLHISQPPLTRQIKALESELGVQLFNRTPRGMELTEAGELFLTEALNVIAVMERATERTQRAGQGKLGRLDVAIFGSAILDTIPKLLLAFRTAYPDVDIVLHTMTKTEQIEALQQRRISVGFNRLLEPTDGIKTELVTRERLKLAIRDSHPLASRKAIHFKDIEPHRFILFPSNSRPNFMDRVISICKEFGFQPKISQEVGDAVTGVALVASGYGVCLVPESATALTLPGVIYREIVDLPEHTSVDLSCIYRESDKSPILNAFLEVMRGETNLQPRD